MYNDLLAELKAKYPNARIRLHPVYGHYELQFTLPSMARTHTVVLQLSLGEASVRQGIINHVAQWRRDAQNILRDTAWREADPEIPAMLAAIEAEGGEL